MGRACIRNLFYAFGALLLLASVSPADARWLRATTNNFVVYGEGSEARLRQVTQRLEQFDALLRILSTRQLPPVDSRLPIYLVNNSRALRIVAPDLPPLVAGFYTATPGAIAAVARRNDSGSLTAQEVLFHEYAHHFMLNYFNSAYPAWFIEGFSEYVAPTQFKDNKADVGWFTEARVLDLVYTRWLPFSRLMTTSVDELSREERSIFYAQSWLLTHYVLTDAGRSRLFVDYLRRLENGEDAWGAFSRVFGVDDITLKKQLDDYRSGAMFYARITLPKPKAHEIVINVMPESADDLLLLGLNAAIGGRADADSSKMTLSRIRTAAARHAGDQFARNALANAEIVYGDPQAALDALGMLESLDGDAEGLYLYGLANLALSQSGSNARQRLVAAQTAFAQAFKINPNHYQTLYRYAQASLAETDEPSENILNVLLRAYELAPQVGEIGINTAGVLMRRGRYEEAIVILRPIASDPHGGELSDYARGMLRSALRQVGIPGEWLQLEPEKRLFDPKAKPFGTTSSGASDQEFRDGH